MLQLVALKEFSSSCQIVVIICNRFFKITTFFYNVSTILCSKAPPCRIMYEDMQRDGNHVKTVTVSLETTGPKMTGETGSQTE
jgi:hypothetical protein